MKWIVKISGLGAEVVPVSLAGEHFRVTSGVDLVWVNLENLPGVGPKILVAVEVSKLFDSELAAIDHASEVLRGMANVLFLRAESIRRQIDNEVVQSIRGF